jgi:hypothetical protein
MTPTAPAVRTPPQPVAADLARQLAHWVGAARTFCDAEEFASADAWRSVEAQVGLPLRRRLAGTVDDLLRHGRAAAAAVRAGQADAQAVPAAQRAVQSFRRHYTQVEVTLDFFGDAVNSRTSPATRTALQALDQLAVQSMEPVLRPLRLPVVPVLVYIDKGLGASILRAGIRLWSPGTVNPVAAIKIVRHNLYRPTSLFHEVGHQVAHLTAWAPALAAALGRTLADDEALRRLWQPWASEIVADVFAFAHTGYASVAALYDVVGDSATILEHRRGDPHPVGWIRALLGCTLCRHAYGPGPGLWDALERSVVVAHPPGGAGDTRLTDLLLRSRARLPDIARACLEAPVPGLGGKPITDFIAPARVAPAALATLERSAGPSLWTSPHWRRAEGIRLVALAGLREAEHPERAGDWIERARTWLTGQALAA